MHIHDLFRVGSYRIRFRHVKSEIYKYIIINNIYIYIYIYMCVCVYVLLLIVCMMYIMIQLLV
jgi:hypothetical protein